MTMIVLFDLNGTLTDPAPIGRALGDPALGRTVLDRAVSSACVDALTGAYRPFAEHVRGAATVLARERGLDDEAGAAAADSASALPARAGADAALRRLAAAGLRLAVLTNSGADGGRRTLERAGLAGHFEAVLGVDAVRSVKPHPSTYRHALDALGAPAGDVLLAAAHDWDVTGAKRAGLRTAFVDHGERPFGPLAEPADVHASGLEDLATKLTRSER